MPSTKESDKWFVRITAPHTLTEPKVLELKRSIDIDQMAIGYHMGVRTAKEHIHIAIKLRKSVQQQSINKRIKTLFGVTGADYSSKIWDGSTKVISYLYHDEKGKVDFHNMTFTDEEMANIKRVHETYKDIVSNAKLKASNRIPDKIIEEILEKGKTLNSGQIITRILKGIANSEFRHPGDQLLIRYVQEIQIRQDPERSIPRMRDYYLEKLGCGITFQTTDLVPQNEVNIEL